jgi:hypothetical protein
MENDSAEWSPDEAVELIHSTCAACRGADLIVNAGDTRADSVIEAGADGRPPANS